MYKIETATTEEMPLFYSTQDSESDLEIGCIGHLRADFGKNGDEFWATWEDHTPELKTDDFRDEFQDLINRLCAADLLESRTAMSDYCAKNPKATLIDGRENNYGFKIKTDKYVYYLRCFPLKGDYNLYCYAYKRSRLEKAYPPLCSKPSLLDKVEQGKQKAANQKHNSNQKTNKDVTEI
jgi:hypothetical protein